MECATTTNCTIALIEREDDEGDVVGVEIATALVEEEFDFDDLFL